MTRLLGLYSGEEQRFDSSVSGVRYSPVRRGVQLRSLKTDTWLHLLKPLKTDTIDVDHTQLGLNPFTMLKLTPKTLKYHIKTAARNWETLSVRWTWKATAGGVDRDSVVWSEI
jgi:hypothetical protein